ncbi:Na+/H+ antiporter NhaA [Romboutsia maritimum]|uniref:Na(+)/H(+) antiporter NhaA n=1 Tax=Romboutsia maritimum TaxID=2020948 RepID=A0A371IS97_9FIRM|nr:Na+/H+ antiporter NhaA [Romboutsia maritimum]RDY23354.1 Na+/H+ antiporter NhaA [Romboutsia maritimum]
MNLSFKNLLKSEVFTGVLLVLATILSLIIANSSLKEHYHHLMSGITFFNTFNLHMFINDFLMAIFFLLVGLEIKHEILFGNLSSFKKASFPILSAFGGVIVPAIIFTIFNCNTEFASGVGIPISTDIAFAVGIFMILKNKIDPSLKIFLLSLAVVDDLISILVIGVLYSSNIKYEFLFIALVLMLLLLAMNKIFKVNKISPYILLGLVLWYLIYSSGVHSTISGVLLAIMIPSQKNKNTKASMLEILEHKLTPICNLIILPLFALVNTAINFKVDIEFALVDTLIMGIVLGLSVGKPLGIMLFSYIGTKLNITEKPDNTSWSSIFCVSILAGIGFTMAIFVSEIAFANYTTIVNISKISILIASLFSIISTYLIANVFNFIKNNYNKSHSIDNIAS